MAWLKRQSTSVHLHTMIHITSSYAYRLIRESSVLLCSERTVKNHKMFCPHLLVQNIHTTLWNEYFISSLPFYPSFECCLRQTSGWTHQSWTWSPSWARATPPGPWHWTASRLPLPPIWWSLSSMPWPDWGLENGCLLTTSQQCQHPVTSYSWLKTWAWSRAR